MGNSMEIPQKTKKYRTTVGYNDSASRYISERNKITVLKRHLYPPPVLSAAIIYNNQDMEKIPVSTNK